MHLWETCRARPSSTSWKAAAASLPGTRLEGHVEHRQRSIRVCPLEVMRSQRLEVEAAAVVHLPDPLRVLGDRIPLLGQQILADIQQAGLQVIGAARRHMGRKQPGKEQGRQRLLGSA